MKLALASLLRQWANKLDPTPHPRIWITYTASPNLKAELTRAIRQTSRHY